MNAIDAIKTYHNIKTVPFEPGWHKKKIRAIRRANCSMRNTAALRLFGRPYSELTITEQDVVNE